MGLVNEVRWVYTNSQRWFLHKNLSGYIEHWHKSEQSTKQHLCPKSQQTKTNDMENWSYCYVALKKNKYSWSEKGGQRLTSLFEIGLFLWRSCNMIWELLYPSSQTLSDQLFNFLPSRTSLCFRFIFNVLENKTCDLGMWINRTLFIDISDQRS